MPAFNYEECSDKGSRAWGGRWTIASVPSNTSSRFESCHSSQSLAMVENNRRAISMCELPCNTNQAMSTTDNLDCRGFRADDACKIMDLVSLKREGTN